MKTWSPFLAIFLCSLSHAANLQQVKSSGALRMATEGTFSPFNYNQGGVLTGFEVELGNEIAKKMGLKPEWKTIAFGSLLIGLEQDRYDLVISSHAMTPEREKMITFISPHYCSGAVIVSKTGGPLSAAALAGKTVAVQTSSIYPQFLKTIPGIKEVKTFQKDEDSIHALIANVTDAAVTDKFLARNLVKKYEDKKLVISPIINPEKNAMAVTKGNSTLQKEVEKTLKELLKDGTYEKLSKKYFNEDIRCR